MFVIPLIGKISWRNPPVITVVLIVLNLFIYFGFQLGDNAAAAKAWNFYLNSGLAKIELPRYMAYSDGKPYDDAYAQKFSGMKEPAVVKIVRRYIADGVFLKQLNGDHIIRPTDAVYANWKTLHQEFLEKRNGDVAFHYGFRPAFHRPVTWLTHMFLHGSVGHVVGNMIFLWLVGCMLEYGAGRSTYPVIYLLGGIAAVSFFWAFNRHSAIQLVGASGAIAALMGAFAVLFGRQRVRIFYSLGFYFGTATVPAILLLPIWVGYQCFEFFFGGASNVAYMAHIGGLLGGGALAFLQLRYLGGADTEVLGDTREDTASPVIEAALHHMEKVDFLEARKLLDQVYREEPDHPDVLRLLFNIDRHYPDRPEIHATTAAFLNQLVLEGVDHADAVAAAYAQYRAAVKTPDLPTPTALRVSQMLMQGNRPADAEGLLALLLKREPQAPGLPGALLRLSEAWHRAGKADRMERCRKIISVRFPGSREADALRRAAKPA